MDRQEWLAHQFEDQRPHLRGVAYRMLGSLSEADDALQDAWLRLSRADTGEVENPRAWLTTIVARAALNMLRARKTRREQPLLLAEESRELGALAPATVGGTPVLLHVEVDDPDAAAERARAAGAIVEMPVAETFWGERYGIVRDPFGHRWALSTAREEFTPDIAHRTPPDIPP
jgi:uncharacterized glyoxalase superfamily protein PhnB